MGPRLHLKVPRAPSGSRDSKEHLGERVNRLTVCVACLFESNKSYADYLRVADYIGLF